MSEHTPGPWKAESPAFGGDAEAMVYDSEGVAVAAVYDRDRARLIAAAPDLKESVKALRRELTHWLAWKNGDAAQPPQRVKGESAVRQANAVMAKARGEEDVA